MRVVHYVFEGHDQITCSYNHVLIEDEMNEKLK